MQPEEHTRKFFIEPLAKKHDRAAFSCGVKTLDQYLERQATQEVKKHAAVAFYEKYGFLVLPKVAKRLFLPMGTIEKLFG